MSGVPTVDKLVAIIMAADTDEAWQRSVARYGPVLLSDLSLITGLAARIVQTRDRGAVNEAERLDRWRSASRTPPPKVVCRRPLVRRAPRRNSNGSSPFTATRSPPGWSIARSTRFGTCSRAVPACLPSWV